MEIRVHRGTGKLQHVIEIGKHRILTDEPPEVGGEDTGPAPHELLAASLGACTALTLALYAGRKGMDLQDIDVRIDHREEDGAFVLHRRIRYIGNLSAEEKERLTQIAQRCPVHRTLTGQIRIVTEQD
jgi:putative redox protein